MASSTTAAVGHVRRNPIPMRRHDRRLLATLKVRFVSSSRIETYSLSTKRSLPNR